MDQIDRTGAERLRALFRGMGQMRHARRGDYLYRAGATLSHLFMIEEGWLSRLRVNTAGKTAFTAFTSPARSSAWTGWRASSSTTTWSRSPAPPCCASP